MRIATKISFIDLESKFIRTNHRLPTMNTSQALFIKKMVILKSDCLHNEEKEHQRKSSIQMRRKCNFDVMLMTWPHSHGQESKCAKEKSMFWNYIHYWFLQYIESYLKHQSLLSNKSIWWQVHEEGEDFSSFYLFQINLDIGTKRVTPFRAIVIKKLKGNMKC